MLAKIREEEEAERQKKRQKPRSWKRCSVCESPDVISFKTPADFSQHLRDVHCTKEGGSFVCKYGYNSVCSSLPVEGVSDQDYERHVARHHIFQQEQQPPGLGAARSTSQMGTPNLIADQTEWTVYSSTQNLSAVLNDPRKSKPRDLFTRAWGDSFVEKSDIQPCPYLPEITRAHFVGYIQRVAKKYKRQLRRLSSSGSRVSADGDQATTTLHKLSLDRTQADLESIPRIFLQPNFSLENFETFNIVFPSVQLGQPNGALPSTDSIPSSSSLKQHSVRLLQEKLSHYLDTVEVQIAKHVSLRSGAFFHAMTSHDALMEQLSSTVQQVKKLRDRVHQIDDILVKGSLHIMKLKHTRQTYVAVYRKLKLMSTVHQTQPTIQLLLSTSDFVGALDLISTTQEVLEQELADVHCFRHLGSQLAELEKVIDKMMQTDFARYATVELNRPLNEEEMIVEEERLVAIVFGMLRQGKQVFVNVYREEAFRTIKAIVRQAIVEAISNSDITESGTTTPASLADQLRLLDFKDWLTLVGQVFERLLKLLRRIHAVHGVMTDAVNVAAGRAHCPASPMTTETPEVTIMQVTIESEDVIVTHDVHVKLINSLRDLLLGVCDYADDRSAKLFTAKSKDGFFEKLTVAEFVILSKVVHDFVSESEGVCGKRNTNLQLALQSQAHRFVTRFHEERKTKLGLILDSERWKQADVPVKFQELAEHIYTAEALSIPKRVSEADLTGDKRTEDVLMVKGEKYAVVGTVLMLLNMVIEYCDCVCGLPFIGADILTRLVELLKTFNSRSCQLVLGAGALQLVGLKTITTKNLALASRCLQLMTIFIPKFKSHFESFLNARQQNVSKQFDQVLKDYNDHVQEISNKLVSIMESMFEAQLNKWEVKPPVPSPCFRAVCRQLSKLNEAIAEVLPIEQVQKLFLRINTAFKGSLKRHLQKRNVVNDGGPQHGLVTSELAFYIQCLKSTNSIRDETDLGMEDIWIVR